MPVPPAIAAATWPQRQAFWLVLVGSWCLRVLVWTLRIRLEDPQRLRVRDEGGPHIFVFWHNRLLLVPTIWQRFLQRGRPRGVAMTSASHDGDLIAHFLARYGIGTVRGSATRHGSAALRELAGWLRRGHDVGLTPDGSRGPRYEIKPGLVLLAQLSGRALLPMNLEYSSAWRTKSWDGFFIPKPFSRVTFIIGEPVVVRRSADPEEFETERRRCEQIMLAQVRER